GSQTADAAPPAEATAAELLARVRHGKKIPVIFDTDIGNDIDDTWALVMLLKSPELDVRLVVADHDNTIYRAKILAKMLQVMGRTDIPVAVGPQKGDRPGRQSAWIGDYTLEQYPGKVYQDGVGALIETIMESPDPITLICVGPVPNIRVALAREPGIARKARFVGMHGSVYRGYGNSPKPSPEWNVRADPKALQAVFAAPWEITITPLDTCGIVHLAGNRYQKVRRCNDPGVQALMRNYEAWAKSQDPSGKRIKPDRRSSTLFDTVAVYLAYSEELVTMEEVPLRVTDKGFTVIDQKGRPVRCATKWKSLDGFKDHLVRRLTGG
ncbi:MAG: nucleoside hydrolase, partial [Planctomycetes bacterium]|nr:nucleoside hydrolase [Planctomycetota bacterium]